MMRTKAIQTLTRWEQLMERLSAGPDFQALTMLWVHLPSCVQVNSLKRISFKEMLQHYKKQPQARPDIFRSVIIEQSPNDLAVTKTGDIIEFYNAVLIPAVKNFVLEYGPHPAALQSSCDEVQHLAHQ